MATIDSFVGNLKDESKDKVLSEVATKIFTDGTGNEASIEFDTANIPELVGSLFSKK